MRRERRWSEKGEEKERRWSEKGEEMEREDAVGGKGRGLCSH